MKNKLFTLIKALITIFLLFLLFSKINFHKFFLEVKDANILYITISALLSYVGVYLSISKWDIFLKNYGIVINKLKLYSVYSISTFFNNFLPTTVGGDFYRVVNLGNKLKENKKEIISSIILERGFGFLSLFLINFLLIPFYYRLIILNKNFLLIQILILIIFIGIVLLFFKYNFLIKLKNKFFKKNIAIVEKFHKLILSITDIKSKKTIFYGLINSIIFCLLIAIARYILFLSFGLEVDFFYILLASSITQIIGIFPISLNSIGVNEGLSVFLFSLINVPLEISLAVALVGRVSMLITSSLGGLFYFFNQKIKF